MSCEARVWDNGDMTDCLASTQHPDNRYCNNCRNRLIAHHRDKVTRLRADLEGHEQTLKLLEREAQRR